VVDAKPVARAYGLSAVYERMQAALRPSPAKTETNILSDQHLTLEADLSNASSSFLAMNLPTRKQIRTQARQP